jgi:hypothetical protein
VFDFAGATFLTLNAAQINECIVINSVITPLPPLLVLGLPDHAALAAQYGPNAVIRFTIGNLQNTTIPNTSLTSSTTVPPNTVRYTNNLAGAAGVQNLQSNLSYTDPYFFPDACKGQMFQVTVIIDSVYQRATYCLTWLGEPS